MSIIPAWETQCLDAIASAGETTFLARSYGGSLQESLELFRNRKFVHRMSCVACGSDAYSKVRRV